MPDTASQNLTNYALPLSDDPQASYTLPSFIYTDPGVYELEKERIFYKTWQYVAHKSFFEKPGDYVTARIGDQNVFVMMGGDGDLRAFYNVCKHRAHELLPDGSGNVGSVIVCPYHAWAYEREGPLRGAPRSSHRPDFNKENYALSEIRLEMFLDCAFINLDDEATSLAEQAGDLEKDVRQRLPFFDDLGVGSDRLMGETNIKAGWKVVVDNYVECYHCDHAHPAFADIICMDDYKHDTFGLWARQLGETIRPDNSAYKVDLKEGVDKSAFWFLWPNTTFNVLPGAREFNISVVRPLGLGESFFGGHTVSCGDPIDEGRFEYTANVLVPEDIALCESVQRGLKSKGYSQGPMIVDADRSGRGEHAIHHFHRLVQAALG